MVSRFIEANKRAYYEENWTNRCCTKFHNGEAEKNQSWDIRAFASLCPNYIDGDKLILGRTDNK